MGKNNEELERTRQQELRSCNWGCLAYPESSNIENIISGLKALHIDFIVSPLHDNDIFESGEIKKPHYHIYWRYNTKKSMAQALSDIKTCFNCDYVLRVADWCKMVRYTIHLDDKDKAQYDVDDCVVYGFDINKYLLDKTEVKVIGIADIVTVVNNNQFTEFSEIVDFAVLNCDANMLQMLVDNSHFVYTYMRSKHFKAKEENNSLAQLESKIDKLEMLLERETMFCSVKVQEEFKRKDEKNDCTDN